MSLATSVKQALHRWSEMGGKRGWHRKTHAGTIWPSGRVPSGSGFTYEADIRAILNGFKFDESMARWRLMSDEQKYSSAQRCSWKNKSLGTGRADQPLVDHRADWKAIWSVGPSRLTGTSLDKVATITGLDKAFGPLCRLITRVCGAKEQKPADQAKITKRQRNRSSGRLC